jgi:hypothetical protein
MYAQRRIPSICRVVACRVDKTTDKKWLSSLEVDYIDKTPKH